MSAVLPVDQAQDLPLGLRRAAADRRELDVRSHAVEVAAELEQREDSPAEIPEELPEAQRVRVDRVPGGALVGLEQLVAPPDTAAGELVVSEAPRADAQPAQILDRIADVRELPVEHGAETPLRID